ncbi:MAG: hypothetical protein AAF253_10775 [Pseudomonadota bacterium]
MTDIFEEVEEAHRQDKVDDAWRKYGWVVWLAGAGVVLAVAANEYLGWQRSEAQAASAGRLEAAIEALDDARYGDAEVAFSEILADGSALSQLAAQYLAQVRLEGQGNRPAAIEALNAVADADGAPLEQMALLKAAYLRSDEASVAELETLLAGLLTAETPLAALAQELVAAKAFAEGDHERARRDFTYLRFAPNAPPGLAQRAEIALTAIPRPAEPVGSDMEGEPAASDGGEGEASRLAPAPGEGAAGGSETPAQPAAGDGAPDDTNEDLGGELP